MARLPQLPAIAALFFALGFVRCADAPVPPAAVYLPVPTHPVTITRPAAPPRVATDQVDALGRPVTVGCATCHSLGLGEPTRKVGQPLTRFHQGLVTRHGELACRACHQAPDYATLHLADGTSLPYTEVQTLCRQCHGPQSRDYDRGSHGGMRGYWDRSRGPRERHACTTCHDPHAPAYPGMIPARGPIDLPHDPGAH